MTHDGSMHALMRTTNTLWIYQSQLIDNQFKGSYLTTLQMWISQLDFSSVFLLFFCNYFYLICECWRRDGSTRGNLIIWKVVQANAGGYELLQLYCSDHILSHIRKNKYQTMNWFQRRSGATVILLSYSSCRAWSQCHTLVANLTFL